MFLAEGDSAMGCLLLVTHTRECVFLRQTSPQAGGREGAESSLVERHRAVLAARPTGARGWEHGASGRSVHTPLRSAQWPMLTGSGTGT